MTDSLTNALTDHAAECQRQRDELRRQLALAEAEGERLRVENVSIQANAMRQAAEVHLSLLTEAITKASEEIAELTAERDRLRAVIRQALFLNGTGTDCQCQGEWCDHCNLRRLLTAALGEDPDAVIEEIERQRGERRALMAERDALARFKAWTHGYLDAQGVPHHPPGTHGAEGCRIGDRMDWWRDRLQAAEAENARLAADLDALRREQDESEWPDERVTLTGEEGQ